MKKRFFVYVPCIISLYLIISVMSCSDDVTSIVNPDTGEWQSFCTNSAQCMPGEVCRNNICVKEDGGTDIEELTDIVVEDTTGDIGLDGGVEDIIDTGDGGADAGGCPGGCGSNASCVNGECVCNTEYGNCNNDWTDGCEVNLNSLSTCGSGCDSIVNCSTLPNVRTARCEGGLCVIGECKSGYDNCDDRVENGCEANLATDPEHCGSCAISCGENSVCNNKVCACKIGHENCNNLWSDGCEVNTANDVNNCGSCRNICDVPNADEICVNSVCQISSCISPYGDCDGQYSNGCEVNVTNDVNNCGWCGNRCNDVPNANEVCVNSGCKIGSCILPYKDGDGQYSNGCEFWDYFPKTYGGGNDDRATFIQQTTDGGYIVSGFTKSFGAGDEDFWVLKLNSSGNIEWQKSYGGGAADQAFSIQETTEGGYIVSGFTKSFGAGNEDFWVLKLNSSGNIEWQKSYGGGAADQAFSIQETTEGGYIVSGFTKSFSSSADFWVLKLKSNGDIEWQKRYGGGGDDLSFSIRETTDGGYIVAGFTKFFSHSADLWVLKLKSNGDIGWQKRYGGGGDDVAYSIKDTTDGGYIVAGYTTSFGNSADFWVLKLKSNGEVEWQRSYGGGGDDLAYSIKETTDGGYIVAGTKSFGSGYEDFWVLKLKSNGEVEWQRSYGEISDDGSSYIHLTRDGKYIVSGATKSFGAGGWDFWILKLNSDGSVDGSCSSDIGATTNATVSTTTASASNTITTVTTTSATLSSTSATVRDTNATTNMQCTGP